MPKLNHTEVQLALFRDGVTGVESIIEDGAASAFTLRRALRELRDAEGADVLIIDELEEMLRRKGFLSQGLTKPDVGDVRGYKIQEERGRKILKVPVDHLQMDSGSEVMVRFEVNGFKGFLPKEI